jgi:colanic acid/amylovoran biosynthesis glycosyltransferase
LSGPLRILSVGRLEWKKGYEYGLEAARLLKARGVPFTYRILGGGSYLEPLAFRPPPAGAGRRG